jgi:hypothetical protein
MEKPLDLNQPLDIYTAKLTFRIKGDFRAVNVQIRYSKKGNQRKERLDFPKDMGENDLRCWKWWGGEMTSVYHRTKKIYRYKDRENVLVHTDLGQKLERLVREVYFRHQE